MRTSPLWTRVSPGGACVVLNFNESARKQPGEAPSNAEQLLSRLRFKCRQMSACRHSGNPFSTEFISIPFVYVHACWKYSSKRCRNGFGIYIIWMSKYVCINMLYTYTHAYISFNVFFFSFLFTFIHGSNNKVLMAFYVYFAVSLI